jgi:hypothetical protein
MTGDVLTRHDLCKRRLVLCAGVILGIRTAETKATAARERVRAWGLSLQQGALLPVRVRECTPPGMLRALFYIGLVGLDEATARDTLLAGVRRERAKPKPHRAFQGANRVLCRSSRCSLGLRAPPAQTPPQPARVPLPARVGAWLVQHRQWVWSGIGTALLIALLAYFLTQKPEPTAGRDIHRIDNAGGSAVIQTGKGKVEINQGEKKP